MRYPVPAQDGASIDRAHEVILVRWEGAEVEVDLDALVRQDRDPSGWSSAVARA